MLIRLVSLLLLFSITGRAEPIELDNSSSPDGKYFLTIEPSPNDYDAGQGTLQIRNTENEKILSSFEWGQFGPRISSTSAKTLWKQDSQAFALTTYTNRGWTNSTVYARNGHKWAELPQPKFTTKYLSKDGWDTRGKGHFVAVKWLPNNILKVDFYDGLVWRGQAPRPADVEEEDYWIYIQLLRDLHGPFLDVRSVEEKSALNPKELN